MTGTTTTATAATATTATTATSSSTTKKKYEHNFNQTSQYTEDTIKQFEATFGKNYMSAGGYETSLETAKLLSPVLNREHEGHDNANDNHDNANHNDQPTILDVGCGIGGVSFFFANQFGAKIHGVDINDVGIQMAKKEMEINPVSKGECQFETLDVTSDDVNFEPETFDVIHSRDVILHLDHEAKLKLFAKFKTWLKPGGMIIICDYCLGPKSAESISPEFQKYLDARGYHLLTPTNYEKAFVDSGFDDDFVDAKDVAQWYCQICRKEVDRITEPGPGRDIFLKSKSEEDIQKLEKVYNDKIFMTIRGDRSYVMVTATKQPSFYNKRVEVYETYKSCSKQNYIMSCDGNVSARANENNFLITPSGVEIPDLLPHKIALCDKNGIARKGECKPSSEFALHAAIYKARPEVNAIVHTHGIYSCALACCRLPLPPAHYAVCELLGPFDFSNPEGGSTYKKRPTIEEAVVQCAPYHTYGSKRLAEVTSKGLRGNYAVLMANHGAIVVGENMDMAMYNTDRLERECEIYWRCLQMQMVGPPKPLTMNEIYSLHKADEVYGQDHPQESIVDDATSSKPISSPVSIDETECELSTSTEDSSKED